MVYILMLALSLLWVGRACTHAHIFPHMAFYYLPAIIRWDSVDLCASSITCGKQTVMFGIRIRTRPYVTHATNTKAISSTFRIIRRIWRYIYSSLRSKYDIRQLNTQTCTHRTRGSHRCVIFVSVWGAWCHYRTHVIHPHYSLIMAYLSQ